MFRENKIKVNDKIDGGRGYVERDMIGGSCGERGDMKGGRCSKRSVEWGYGRGDMRREWSKNDMLRRMLKY